MRLAEALFAEPTVGDKTIMKRALLLFQQLAISAGYNVRPAWSDSKSYALDVTADRHEDLRLNIVFPQQANSVVSLTKWAFRLGGFKPLDGASAISLLGDEEPAEIAKRTFDSCRRRLPL